MSYRQVHTRGQALIEFVFCLPILTILLTATFAIGVVMYTGANASTALKTAIENKVALADNPAGVPGQIQNFVNQYNSGSFQVNGSNVDNLNAMQTGPVIGVVISRKQIVPPPVAFIGMPNFNFTLIEGIHSAYMRTNTGPFSTIVATPINLVRAQYPATVNPANFDITGGIPNEVPIEENCTPDMTVFSDQKESPITFTQACVDVAGCPLTQVLAFVNDHTSAIQDYACAEGIGSTDDVTFRDIEAY